MNLRTKLESILDKDINDMELFRAVSPIVNRYRLHSKGRLTYNIAPLARKKGLTVHQVSELIVLDGWDSRKVYNRFQSYSQRGFAPEKEIEDLTSEVCRVLGVTREDLVIKAT